MSDTLASSAANQGDNTASVAQGGTATPGATEQLLPSDRVFKRNIYLYFYIHTGHCWRSKDELISNVLLWTPTYGCAKAGRPAQTYMQQLCEDTGCNLEDLPEAMNDREKWRERVRDIRAGGATWWWWWWWSLERRTDRFIQSWSPLWEPFHIFLLYLQKQMENK